MLVAATPAPDRDPWSLAAAFNGLSLAAPSGTAEAASGAAMATVGTVGTVGQRHGSANSLSSLASTVSSSLSSSSDASGSPREPLSPQGSPVLRSASISHSSGSISHSSISGSRHSSSRAMDSRVNNICANAITSCAHRPPAPSAAALPVPPAASPAGCGYEGDAEYPALPLGGYSRAGDAEQRWRQAPGTKCGSSGEGEREERAEALLCSCEACCGAAPAVLSPQSLFAPPPPGSSGWTAPPVYLPPSDTRRRGVGQGSGQGQAPGWRGGRPQQTQAASAYAPYYPAQPQPRQHSHAHVHHSHHSQQPHYAPSRRPQHRRNPSSFYLPSPAPDAGHWSEAAVHHTTSTAAAAAGHPFAPLSEQLEGMFNAATVAPSFTPVNRSLSATAPAFEPSSAATSGAKSNGAAAVALAQTSRPALPQILRGKEVEEDNQDDAEEMGEDDGEDAADGMELLRSYLYHKYLRFRDRALAERRQLGPGRSPLVSSLYKFWVERLQHKFNRQMYQTFKETAMEDSALAGSREGMECLYVFLRRSLLSLYRERVFRDLIYLVGAELHQDGFGLEQLWHFLRERNEEVRLRSELTVRRRVYSRPDMVAALRQLDRYWFE